MLLNCIAEYRGKTIRTNEKGEYHYINLEDEDGESAKFSVDNSIDLSLFNKGDYVNATLDYNSKYGSLKVVHLTKE